MFSREIADDFAAAHSNISIFSKPAVLKLCATFCTAGWAS